MITDTTLWGVQPNGFYAPNTAEIVAVLSADLQAAIPNLDTDPDAIEGQQVGIYSAQAAALWEGLKVVHDSNNPDNAEGDLLVDLAMLSGTPYHGPKPTRVIALVTLAAGTTLTAGVSTASLAGHPELTFTPVSDYTAADDGTFQVIFEAFETGPTVVTAGQLSVIASPTSGWTNITNEAAGVTGTDGDTDATLRLRREVDLAKTGTSTALALQADIEALTDVTSAKVLENHTATIDGNSVPGNSFECLVYGTPDTTALAQAIWEGGPMGISSTGTTTISYVDSYGITRSVKYTPISAVPIYLAYTLTKLSTYVGDTTFKSDVVTALQKVATPGADVIAVRVAAVAFSEQGVADVPAFALGTSPGPTGTSNISIGVRQIATFSAANVSVT